MNTIETTGLILVLIGGIGLAHTYAFYPISWWVIGKLCGNARVESSSANASPLSEHVSVIVAAYNEEAHIGERVKNLL